MCWYQNQFPNYNAYISEKELQRITIKTLIILGDQDNSIPLDCVSQVRKNLPASYLWILPNSGHGAHEGKNKEEFIRVSKEFFMGIGPNNKTVLKEYANYFSALPLVALCRSI